MLELADVDELPLRMLFGRGINELMHSGYQRRLDLGRALGASARAQGRLFRGASSYIAALDDAGRTEFEQRVRAARRGLLARP